MIVYDLSSKCGKDCVSLELPDEATSGVMLHGYINTRKLIKKTDTWINSTADYIQGFRERNTEAARKLREIEDLAFGPEDL